MIEETRENGLAILHMLAVFNQEFRAAAVEEIFDVLISTPKRIQ